ncbi:MAG TPA: HAD-IIIC family phosphatase [Actinomycetota bacterium]|nr:HAD-IIIC family phosphatase [Actinomycetota bacterium]
MTPRPPVKCLVWDLDDTLWRGTLLEDAAVVVDPRAVEVVRELDRRGILNSIASRNEEALALRKLREHGLDEYFLYPQINWNAKDVSVKAVADALNVGIDTIAFVDDQPFDREEVAFSLPEVRCYSPDDLASLLDLPDFDPPFVTPESARRRLMYLADAARTREEAAFAGPKEEFLASLSMRFTISEARERDLQRAEELTVRTNQLNTTGRTYSYDELKTYAESDAHLLLVAELEDKHGTYGKIGLALVETGADAWVLKLLLMSCRVMSRGVGTVMLNHVMRLARAAGARLLAELVPNDRNRMMLITLRLGGFEERGREGDTLLLESTAAPPPPPDYLELVLG